METYIKTKLDDYLYELSLNNFIINSWRKLELIIAYKNKALLYEDVPEYIKEKYNEFNIGQFVCRIKIKK